MFALREQVNGTDVLYNQKKQELRPIVQVMHNLEFFNFFLRW